MKTLSSRRDRAAVAALLWDALEGCKEISAEAKKTATEHDCEFRAVGIVVGNFTESAGSISGTHDASIHVDLITGRRIIKEVERIVRERMVELGELDISEVIEVPRPWIPRPAK